MGFEDLGEDLSEEQKARLRECKTKEEFVSILEEVNPRLAFQYTAGFAKLPFAR